MIATIKSYDGKVRLETEINIGSKRKFKLMEEDYVTLKFSLTEPVWFHLGDYADIEGFGRFVLVDPYKPDYNTSTGGHDYELKLESQYMKWRNKILRFMPMIGGNECSFKLTATASVHLELIAANISALAKEDSNYLYDGRDEWEFVVLDGVDASAKFISFEQTNILDALTTIAETFDCEWWVDGRTVYLGKCGQTETRDYIDLSLDKNVAKMAHSRSQEKLATRIIPFGSTRNISPRYRKDLLFTVTDAKTVNGLARISDSARPLSADMFNPANRVKEASSPVSLRLNETGTVTNPSTSIQPTKTYINACSASAPLLDSLFQGQTLPINFKEWRIKLYFNNHRKGNQSAGVPEDCKLTFSITSGGRTLLSREITQYIDATAKTIEVTPPQDLKYKADANYEDLKLTIALSVGLWPGCSLDYTLGSSGTITAEAAQEKELSAKSLTLEVVDTSRPSGQNVTKTISGVIFNPDFEESLSGRNWLQLPAGNYLNTGEMFRILELDEFRVKSSYFTSRYILYSNNTNISKNGIVPDRLMLPEDDYSDHYYIDIRSDLSAQEAVEDVVVFEDIYPRAECVVTDVIPFDAKETVENDDGTDSDAHYTAFYLKDTIFTANDKFKEEYRIPDTDLEIIFGDCDRYTEADKAAGLIPVGKAVGDAKHEGSGKLNGWTFKVNYTRNSDREPVWEVIRDSDSYIPNDILRPMVGDTFVVVGYDTAFVDEELVKLAEEELRDKTTLYVEKINEDTSTYDCTMMCDWAEENMMWMYPGARVNLVNDAFFPTVVENGRAWGRKSRVIGFEICLDIPADNPVFTIGEKPSYSRFGDIQSQIDSMNLSASSGFYASSSSSGNSSVGNAMLSEAKAFALANFLSKRYADRTPYRLSSDTAFEAGNYVGGVSGGILGIDKVSGKSFAEVDDLWVRCKAYFESLTVIESETLAGRQYITPGGSVKCVAVRDASGRVKHEAVVAVDAKGRELASLTDSHAVAYRCYYLEEQAGEKSLTKMEAGDQAISRTFNVPSGSTGQVTNHYWWRLVTKVANAVYTDLDTGNVYGYIEVSAEDCDGASGSFSESGITHCDIPAEGDVIAQLGNRDKDKPERQSAIVLDTVGSDAPSLKMFSGINDFTLADKAVISFGTDPKTGGVYFRLGSSSATQYLNYSQKGVGSQGQLTIAGKIVATSGIVDSEDNDLIGNPVVSTEILFLSQTESAEKPDKTTYLSEATTA